MSATTKLGTGTTKGEIGGGFSYSRSRTNVQSLDITKDSSKVISRQGPAMDGVDHDADVLVVWLNPKVSVTATQTSAAWTFEGRGPANIQYIYVSQLKNPASMPTGLKAMLDGYGFTPKDYADLLALDPFAVGSPSVDTARFLLTNYTFPDLPP